MIRDTWLTTHSYLQPLAELHAVVDAVPVSGACSGHGIPSFDTYDIEFRGGVPLLHSITFNIDFSRAKDLVSSVIGVLSLESSFGELAKHAQALDGELHRDPDSLTRAVAWLLGQGSFLPTYPGLFRWLGWSVLARALSATMHAFGVWRDDEKWLRNYCPGCGALPAMAQLAGTDPARVRFLSCGCCKTRWHYRRACCPFCQSEHDRGLRLLEVDAEGNLRIDYCEDCSAYIKTYNGQGYEEFFLADWTSIHLDMLALNRGLKRKAASLYEI